MLLSVGCVACSPCRRCPRHKERLAPRADVALTRQPSAIELPATQGGRGRLPAVNPNMTSNLAEADAAAAAAVAAAARSKAELDGAPQEGVRKLGGEGIVEKS